MEDMVVPIDGLVEATIDSAEMGCLRTSSLAIGSDHVAGQRSSSRASDDSYPSHLNRETGTLFVFFTGGIVFLTLVINGSTTQFILHLLGMDKLSAAKMRILDYTRHEMLDKALEAFGDLGDDEELGPTDWPTVKRHISCLSNLGGQVHPHNVSEEENYLHTMNLTDMRVRLLNGVQAAYWGMLDEGRITQSTAIILMQSVDEAIDLDCRFCSKVEHFDLS
ncbi:Son of sevenless 1 [Asimina triloba]